MARTRTVPDDAVALQQFLANPTAMAQALADPREMQRFAQAYGQAFAKKDPDFEATLAEQRQRVLATMLREQGYDGPPVDLRPSAGAGAGLSGRVRERQAPGGRIAPGAPLDGVFDGLGDFLRTVHPKADVTSDAVAGKLRRHRETVRNASTTVPSEGGFLVPEQYRGEVMFDVLEQSIVRPRATVLPMSSQRLVVPAVDATSNVTSVFGGVVASWTEEGAALTPTDAKFGRTVLDAKKLTAYVEAPNELVADAPAFTAFLNMAMPSAISFYEDLAFLTGTGSGEPLGMLNSGATVTVTAEGSQPAASIVWENVGKMFARMLPGSLANAVWLCSPECIPELTTMALSVGTGGSAIWINNGSEGPPMRILGRPLIVSEKMPQLGAEGDISFVDLRHYLVGDRMALEAKVSEHYRFQNDETAFRFIERVDGRPWVQSAITPANGGDSLSPVVKLAARP